MATGSKGAELRAGVVVLVGLVVLATGLYLVSGGKEALAEKNRLTILFEDVGGIGRGADVYVAGQKAGEVTELKGTEASRDGVTRRFVAITIEFRREFEIPADSRFTISRSITNVITFNVALGVSKKLAREDTQLFGQRLATFEELVNSGQELVGVVRQGAEHFDELMLDAREKVREIDIVAVQEKVDETLTSLRDAANEARDIVTGNRGRIERTLQNLEELSADLKSDWREMNPKMQRILDDTGDAAADVKGILRENREVIKSVFQQLDDGMRRLAPALAQVETLGHQVNDAVAELRPEIRRGLAAATTAMGNFRDLTEDLRTAPWKLLNKPSDRESDDVHLYNAARLYVDAAGRVAIAVQDLEALQRMGVLSDPERADLVQRTLASMAEALESFEANQKRFTNLIADTADAGK